jgi:hypothetical protein
MVAVVVVVIPAPVVLVVLVAAAVDLVTQEEQQPTGKVRLVAQLVLTMAQAVVVLHLMVLLLLLVEPTLMVAQDDLAPLQAAINGMLVVVQDGEEVAIPVQVQEASAVVVILTSQEWTAPEAAEAHIIVGQGQAKKVAQVS